MSERRAGRRPFGDPRALVAVCALAATVRVSYLVGSRRHPLTSDAAQYSKLATNLAHGRGLADYFPGGPLHATAFRPPLYPLFLSVFYRLFGASPGLGRVVNVCIGVCVVGLTFLTVDRFVSRVGAVAAGVAAAVMPNLVANDIVTLSDPLSLLLILFLVNLLLRRRWLWAGVAAGLLVLTRDGAQFIVALLGVALLVRVGWRRALTFVLASALLVAPWVTRNWLQLGRPLLYTSNGFNWAAMYSPQAEAAGAFVDPVHSASFAGMNLDPSDEVEWSRRLQKIGEGNLERHPSYVFHVTKRNLLAYWELQPSLNTGAENADGRSMRVVTWTLPVFYLEAVAGLAGLWVHRRRALTQLFALLGAYFMLASLVFISAPRLRGPVDLALGVGVGLLADSAARTFRDRSRVADVPARRE